MEAIEDNIQPASIRYGKKEKSKTSPRSDEIDKKNIPGIICLYVGTFAPLVILN